MKGEWDRGPLLRRENINLKIRSQVHYGIQFIVSYSHLLLSLPLSVSAAAVSK